MKRKEVPQDRSGLSKKGFKELCYAVDEEGKYTTALSQGWEPKTIALDNALEEIERRKAEALEEIRMGKASPIVYFMEVHRMDLPILAAYIGMWQWRVKRHFKPNIFKKLRPKQLEKYAKVFQISVEELKNFKG
ncbi:MAG: hypothetical protein OIF50_03660 [Flavobacteriaceae bacterium]|nr:hypothetical protein [Flavobacteriaceae bacterium]